jgi:putative GTP pyrophosphokinase
VTNNGKNLQDEFDFRKWYIAFEPKYQRLAESVRGIIEKLLIRSGISFHSITCRTKAVESAVSKIQRKGYNDPPIQIHDFAGVRVITFIEADAVRSAEVISKAFHVNEDKTPDKIQDLGIDRIGYRSTHLICDLGSDRLKLPEFQDIAGLVFEVQVRTILQHAWAEFEHDRNYKFAGILPTELRRRLFLAAGLLEIADREFDQLDSEMSLYAEKVSADARRGELEIELNSTSLAEYIKLRIPEKDMLRGIDAEMLTLIIGELNNFGVATLTELDRLITPEFFEIWRQNIGSGENILGLTRWCMMYADINKYFDKAWNNHWNLAHQNLIRVMKRKYGDQVIQIFEKAKIAITTH